MLPGFTPLDPQKYATHTAYFTTPEDALIEYARRGDLGMVQYLLTKHQANPQIGDGIALKWAKYHQHDDVTQLLVRHGVTVTNWELGKINQSQGR